MDKTPGEQNLDSGTEDLGMRSSEGTRSFREFLSAHPEARASLQQRMEAFPEYREWLQAFGKGVLASLEPERSTTNGVR